MHVKLIQFAPNAYMIAPADSENQPTLIIMIGTASKRSVLKTVKKNGYTVTQHETR